MSSLAALATVEKGNKKKNSEKWRFLNKHKEQQNTVPAAPIALIASSFVWSFYKEVI